MGSSSSFGQAVQEILLNNYLRTNFEISRIRNFVPTFRNFKSPHFLNAKFLKTAYAKKVNEPI